jgi:xylan 1,4-beta-xylosidase
VWNLDDPDKMGTVKNVRLVFRGLPANVTISISRVDDDHGNTLAAYKAMGSPVDPTDAQVEQLNRKTALGAPERRTLANGELNLTVSTNALLLVKVGTHREDRNQ